MTKRKQQRDLYSLFAKCAHKENGESSNPNALPAQQSQAHSSSLNQNEECCQTGMEKNSNVERQPVVFLGRLTDIDVSNLPEDPGLRRKLIDYHKDDRDRVRREYCSRGPCQPKDHNFPYTVFSNKNRRFNPEWFDKYETWIEYSVEKDAAFCLPCYLFKEVGIGQNAFVCDGFRTWSKPSALDKHVGPQMSAHRKAMEKFVNFKNQKVSIEQSSSKQDDKQDEEDTRRYKKRLEASVRCLKWLLLQGLAFHSHDEKVFSYDRDLFNELLKFHVEGRSDLEELVLESATSNYELTSASIQKDIINACAKETIDLIIKDVGDDCFSIFVGECVDICDKEQWPLCLRYVAKNGGVVERFLSIMHVHEATSNTLKNAIEAKLMEHSLTLSRVRGQCYDGMSTIEGTIGGLKTLILNECSSAYYVHSFSYQLHITLVAVAKKNQDFNWLYDEVFPRLLSFLGGSPKRKEFLRQKQKDRVVEAFSLDELGFGTMLNEELSLARVADISWGSHFKIIKNVISLFRPILESLDAIAESLPLDTNKAFALLGMLMTFDFVFLLHLMGAIFGITNNFSLA